MPYQAEADVTIPRPIGSREIPGTGQRVELKESVNYVAGAIVLEKDMTPGIRRRLEEGTDDHLSSLLRYVDPSEARQILGQQARAAASQAAPESQILHQEERLESDGPQLSTETEVPYEEPVGEPKDGKHVVTEDQTLAQGTDAVQPETEVEADEEGSSESTGDADTEVEEETEAEAAEDESTSEDEGDGQDPASESQENSTEETTSDSSEEESGDAYDSMDFDALRKEVRDRKIEGRSKLKTEAEFRAALRKNDAVSE